MYIQMKTLTANEIREKFLTFFVSKGHKRIASDSVVPKDDPTVLFTTAGMQQFKRQFLGNIDDFTRATTSQKCIRTDDLDEVGQTNFHHTLFEMLGNFSFGDYFKKEAITWAWEFLTQVLGIDPKRLWVSVYREDEEAFGIWKNTVGIPEHKIFKLGDKSNFWPSNAKQNGPNGPCGPCSEIFFDYHPEDKTVPKDPDDISGRFAEIWNLVFTQFNRKDGGILEPLPSKNIDTGMGLERLCAVMQGVSSNFETDLFVPIIAEIDKITTANLSIAEKRIIADHIRAATFAIADGVIPSNKERGSVVKTLINRSINLVLKNNGKQEACVYQLVRVIAQVMKTAYPEISQKADTIAKLIEKTEAAFIQVWQQRVPEIQQEVKKNLTAEELGKVFFFYQDTYGLPISTSSTIALAAGVSAEKNTAALSVSDKHMNEQRERSRAGSKMAGDVFVDMELDLNVPKTKFLGYETMTAKATVLRIFKGQESVDAADAGDTVRIVLDQTPFYAESGGQVGDTGLFTTTASGIAQISDTKKLDAVFLHHAQIQEGQLSVGQSVTVAVDTQRRLSIMRNHTATHLLQAALRKILGEHVQQQGSAVDEQRLRFDFTQPSGLSAEQKAAVEDEVNGMIQANIRVEKKAMSIEEARRTGALAFFAEKYGETVRVINVPGCSTELCGGTHLDNTGEIKLFKIVSESAIAQGIRRIEAATGSNAEAFLTLMKQRESEEEALRQKKEKEKEHAKARFQNMKAKLPAIIENAPVVKGARIVSHIFPNADIDILRQLSDTAKQLACSGAIILGTSSNETASMIVSITDDLIGKRIKAGDIIKESAPVMGGNGGGRPEFAQAGGKDISKLKDAMEKAKQLIVEKLS